jgi:hypothetical protein
MTDQTPAWLSVMRTLTGTKEIAGPEANPVITGMADEIARHYPDMKWYCDLPSWDSDETAWCGMAAAYCMAQAGQRPPFQQKPADDTARRRRGLRTDRLAAAGMRGGARAIGRWACDILREHERFKLQLPRR